MLESQVSCLGNGVWDSIENIKCSLSIFLIIIFEQHYSNNSKSTGTSKTRGTASFKFKNILKVKVALVPRGAQKTDFKKNEFQLKHLTCEIFSWEHYTETIPTYRLYHTLRMVLLRLFLGLTISKNTFLSNSHSFDPQWP